MVHLLTTADKILIAVLVCSVVGSFLIVGSIAVQGTSVLVQVDGMTVHKANLLENSIIQVDGVRGELTIETKDGRVAVTRADCPNHVCVRTGWRSKGGDVIVCVPNKCVVRILAEDQKGVRAVTG